MFVKASLVVVVVIAGLLANLIYKNDPFDETSLVDEVDIRSDFKYIPIETYDPKVILQTIEIGENDPSKELVILLHGFPETALLSWHHLLGEFADSNKYYVLAPDMRGYNKSSKPENMMDYYMSNLVADVHAIIHKFAKRKKAHVIAHDWGSIVAWLFAARFTDSLDKLVIMNGPSMSGSDKASLEQFKKSWYVLLFQLPAPLPEIRFSKNNFETLKNLYSQWMRYKVSKPVMNRLLQAWSEPSHLHSNINWYRALLVGRIWHSFTGNKTETGKWIAEPHVTVKRPTLVLWGLDDACMIPEIAYGCFENTVDDSVKPQSKLVTYADSGHFVQHEKSKEVTKEIMEFLK